MRGVVRSSNQYSREAFCDSGGPLRPLDVSVNDPNAAFIQASVPLSLYMYMYNSYFLRVDFKTRFVWFFFFRYTLDFVYILYIAFDL